MRLRRSVSQEEVAKMAVSQLADAHLRCRDLRHAWTHDEDLNVPMTLQGSFHFDRVLVCMRCGTSRIDRLALSRGYITKEGARYRYAKDYLLPKGVDARAILGEVVRRWGVRP